MTDIFLDGKYIGKADEPEKFVDEIRERRRNGLISSQINVAYHKHLDEVKILSDSGRARRPLIIVEGGKPKLTSEHVEKLKRGEIRWDDLIKTGIIEYLDSEEEENAYIALKPEDLTQEHTHLEIDPSLILGLSASFIPYPEFNRGDRVNYGAKMIGQSIGLFSTNYLNRVDTKSNVLLYPQNPLVQTHAHKLIEHDKHPNGTNIVVAVCCFEGYNTEDAIVINESSIQRGLFWSMMLRAYEAEQKRYMGGQEDIIGIPEPGVRGYAGEDAHKHLPEDGIINPETSVKSDDILIGRISPLRFLGTMDQFITGIENIRETSVRLRHGDMGVVDRVFLTETAEGTKFVKVIVRDTKIPEIGDKFASRHGQKGVIGLIVPQEDMPFTEQGIVPDIVFNPHGIPSRMTMGQLLELIAGKVSALSGENIYSPAFDPMPEKELRRLLESYGFRNDGKETMYDGRTGRKFEAQIFIGNCFYQKLDHLVSNKIHARSRGPVTLLTKQPTEGRSKEGGLRLGEMEKDCLIAHGAALVLKERFDSDKTSVPICTECGLVATDDRIKNRKYCHVCGESKVVDVEMSYAFKLMLDELKSMLIYPKIVLNLEEMQVDRIEFGIISPELIRKMNVAKTTKTELYDQEGYPIEGGLMDPRLGVVDPGVRCRTCGGSIGECQGHFGFLELTRPVIHVHYAKILFRLLKFVCRKCSRILIEKKDIEKIEKGRYTFKDLLKFVRKKCPYCGEEQRKFRFIRPYTITEDNEILNPIKIRERFEKFSDEDLEIIGLKKMRPEWTILTLLPIPSVTTRPSITLETGARSEDDLTHKLVDIVRINERLRENIDLGAPEFIIEDLWELLQYHVATYLDNEISGVPPARHRSGRILKTLSQRLKTKEGRFRGNLAGKRVNFSARTVISPDPMIDIDEVGVPDVIARELTLPVRVNEMNIESLRALILNGSDAWPGANYVIRQDGRRKKITEENKEEIAREISPGYIVERHVRDGDVALFNRQPSLHRMSIMGHRIRVMPYKTFRLNISVCVAPETKVMLDGSIQRKIEELRNCWKESRIITSNLQGNKELLDTELKAFWCIKPQEHNIKCYEIKTESGRKIKVTEDHPFYTENGIMEAKNLEVGQRVIVYPNNFPEYEKVERILVTEEDIKEKTPAKTYIKHVIKGLKKRRLLPLNLDNPKVLILARLLGHLFGDGTFILDDYVSRAIFRGEKQDLEEIRRDILTLGFKPEKIKEREYETEITKANGKKVKVSGTGYSFEIRNKPLGILLKILGAPSGDKIIKDLKIPKWIKQAPKYVKKEFLASYFGSELTVPRIRKKCKKEFERLIFKHGKIEEKLNSSMRFLKEIEKMLEEFNVEVINIKTQPGNIRKGGKKTIINVVTLSSKLNSLINFFGKIGYIYKRRAESLSRLAFAYLKNKRKKIEKRREIARMVINKKIRRGELLQLARKTNIKPEIIYLWRYKKIRDPNISIHFPTFNKWAEKNVADFENGFIYEKIIEIKDVEIPYVCDITTTSDTHNFIANGFLTGNCVPFNADFDGDEMNLHIPQTEEAQVEAETLMAVPKHIRSPRFSGPIIGAVRDHLSGLYILTNGYKNFERKEFVQLVRSVDEKVEIPKKKSLTGKEIFSLFLPKGFSMEHKAKCCVGCRKCLKAKCPYDAYVIIRRGRLVKGTIDKASIGTETGRMIDRLEKEYGRGTVKKFLFDITKLSIEVLMRSGFSISISDQDLPEEAKVEIKKIIEKVRKEVDELIELFERGELRILTGRTPKQSLETLIKRRLNRCLNEIEGVLEKYMKENFTVVMARSGARGSLVNIVQTAACIGQETIMGERMERGYFDRTFPHFKRGDMSLEAKGFVSRGFKDGLTPFEFFFDAINSRESLMDKSLKTRHSGYMERRLVGALQDLKVEYDGTVRDSLKRIVQFLPGEDGLDPSKVRRDGIDVEGIAKTIFG